MPHLTTDGEECSIKRLSISTLFEGQAYDEAQGCKNLWVNCLFTAIRSAKHGNADDIFWLYSSQAKHVGSLHYICEALNVDINKIRAIPREELPNMKMRLESETSFADIIRSELDSQFKEKKKRVGTARKIKQAQYHKWRLSPFLRKLDQLEKIAKKLEQGGRI